MKLDEVKKSRLDILNEQIAEFEIKVQQATDAWAEAKLNRNDVQIHETEEQLIQLTTELNALKMRRPV